MSRSLRYRLLAALRGALSIGSVLVVSWSATPASAQSSTGEPVALAPHRAVYEIELAESRGASSVANMSGRMVYELSGSACAGYTQSMRFVTRISSQDGSPSISDLRSTSWEDVLAKAFRFSSTQYKDAKLEDFDRRRR